MSAYAPPPQIDSAAIEKLLIALIAHVIKFPNGVTEIKKAFHRTIGKGKGQLERTVQLEIAISYLIHEGLDLVVAEDGEDEHQNAELGKRVKSLVKSRQGHDAR